MSIEKGDRFILPPPRLLPQGELPAVIEPGFRDLAPPAVEEAVEEYEEFVSKPTKNGLTEELIRKAQATALANAEVNRLIDNKRYIAIGGSILENKSEDDEHQPCFLMFLFYNYTDNVTNEVILDKDANNVIKVEVSHYQPAPIQQEIDEAIDLAKKDLRLAEKLTEDLQGNAILINSVDPEDEYYNHRQFDVRFGFPDERLPLYSAVVDLSTQTVLKAGLVCPQEIGRKRG